MILHNQECVDGISGLVLMLHAQLPQTNVLLLVHLMLYGSQVLIHLPLLMVLTGQMKDNMLKEQQNSQYKMEKLYMKPLENV